MPPNKKAVAKVSSKKKMLINADHPEECRAVVVDDGKLEEIIIEHSSRELVKGNVYLGVITRVEPAIEAAFVDFGGKKFGFLPFKDVLRESYLQTGEKKAKVRIQDVLVRGQKILVQAVKESRDAKGPSLNNGVTIPGRFLVLMYGSASTGVSRKIEDESERKKLKEILSGFELPENMGVIIRTAGVGRTKTELQKDLQVLLKIWDNIQETIKTSSNKAPIMLYEGPDMVVRTVRDHFTADTSEIIVDNVDSYKSLREFTKMVIPRLRGRVKLYKETKPLFSQYNIEDQIESIYERKVLLPSGGSIVIDIGEAMVSVDVNSGKTTSASELEETALRTNLEAADEVARQLRLRDLGGLIVIDFIDMFQKKNKSLVEKQLKTACKNDKARVNISRISRFGLMEMSRQRLSPPVKEGVFESCQTCQGTGLVKTRVTLILHVLRRIQEMIAGGQVKTLSITLSNDVMTYLFNTKKKFLVELEEKNGCTLQFTGKPNLALSDFVYTIVERKKPEPGLETQPVEEEENETAVTAMESETKPDREEKAEGKSDNTSRRKPEGTGTRRRSSSRKPGGPRRPGTRGRRYRSPKGKEAEPALLDGAQNEGGEPSPGNEKFPPTPDSNIPESASPGNEIRPIPKETDTGGLKPTTPIDTGGFSGRESTETFPTSFSGGPGHSGRDEPPTGF